MLPPKEKEYNTTELTVKQAAEKAGKNVETIRRWVKMGKIEARKDGQTWQISQTSLENYLASLANSQTRESSITKETIAQIAAKVAAELRPMLEQAKLKEPGQAEPLKESEAIRKENEELKAKVSWLENQVQSVKEYLKEIVEKQQNQAKQQNQPSKESQTKLDKQAKPKLEEQKQGNVEPGKATSSQAEIIDAQRAERWLRENLEWIDQVCPFKHATSRTWRELGENKGPKIAMNGKGPQPPRAYLHALESWQSCKPWAKLKAKIALEVSKNGTAIH